MIATTPKHYNGQIFAGYNIILYLKNGKVTKIGAGIFLSCGDKVHILTGIRNEKSICVSNTKAKEENINMLREVTYQALDSGITVTLTF